MKPTWSNDLYHAVKNAKQNQTERSTKPVSVASLSVSEQNAVLKAFKQKNETAPSQGWY
ncbi:hypothetical protein ACFFK0_16895 [Paenibacillus chartarius]|uniref:Uncharacterized protein n=1 Tax=Paenibacillus chartarius TaxID=747481 RepID=A0ABV6DND0_9BACL